LQDDEEDKAVTVQRDPELRDAEQHWLKGGSALPHVCFIRERATDEQKCLLDRAGIPLP
jgi:hypothetical protein